MSTRVWHKGPPPHVGWWNAGVMEVEDFWRWWDGRVWSAVVEEHYLSDLVHSLALRPASSQQGIRWTDYYPENARVPRVKP